MKTLEDAWQWYKSARNNLIRMKRLGTHHWTDPSLAQASFWQDDRFKRLEAVDIERQTNLALAPLEDLGVLVLFSVFEAAVRDHLAEAIRPESDSLVHPILKQAAEDVFDGIRQGSLANKVLSPLKDQGRISAQLSDKVKQVRDYRNWVAHGKREPRPANIVSLTAHDTFERLKEFLDVLDISAKPELEEPVELDGRGLDNELD